MLSLTVVYGVAFAFPAEKDTNEHVRAVGRDCGDGRDVGEEQDAIYAGVCYVGKFLEDFSRLIEGAMEGASEIAVELMLDAHGYLFEARGA